MRRPVAVLALASSLACGSGANTPAPSTPTAPSAPAPSAPSQSAAEGSWKLSSVDGAALPYALADTSHGKLEIAGIALSIKSPSSSYGLYTETITWRRPTSGQQFTSTEEGAWTLAGTRIQLVDVMGFSAVGSVNGDTMTLTSWDLKTYVYTR